MVSAVPVVLPLFKLPNLSKIYMKQLFVTLRFASHMLRELSKRPPEAIPCEFISEAVST